MTHLIIWTQRVREKEAKHVGGTKCREPLSTFLLTRKDLWGYASSAGSHKHVCEQHTRQPLNRGWALPTTQARAQQPTPSWVLALETHGLSQPRSLLAASRPARVRGQRCVCWRISPRCPVAAAGTVVVSGHPLQGGAWALAPEPAGSWSEGLLFHHRVLTLHDLNRVLRQWILGGSGEGRFALRSKPYPMGPHPFCAQRSKAGAYGGP